MSFLAPILLGLLGLAIPVVIAFLSRKKVEQRVVPSLVILKHLESGKPRSKKLGVPRNMLALLLYILALVAIVFAVSQPVFEGEEPRDVVIVLDASYSMGARHPGETLSQLELATARIEEEVLDHLGPRDRASLVVADVRRQVVVELTRDLGRHRDALAEVRAQGMPEHVASSLRLGDALCMGSEREARELIFVTDGYGLDGRLPDAFGCPLDVMIVSDRDDVAGDTARPTPQNLAISALVSRQVDALGEHEVYVEVLNASDSDQEVAVELELDGVIVEVVSLGVPAGERKGKLFALNATDGDILRATLSYEDAAKQDAFALDDVAFTVLRDIALIDVLVVSEREFSFVYQAFKLHPRVRATKVAPAQLTAQMLGGKGLVIVEDAPGAIGIEPALDPGAVVWWMGPFKGLGATFFEEMERPELGWWDFGADIFRYVDMDDVEILSASSIETQGGDEVLIRAGQDQALMLKRPLADAKDALISAFHPEQSDLILRVAFVNIVANVVEMVAKRVDVEKVYTASPGEVFGEVRDLEQLRPLVTGSKDAASIEVGDPMTHTGVWQLVGGEHEGELVVVNFEEMSESMFARQGELSLVKDRADITRFDREAFASSDRGAKLIRWLLLFAFGAMVLEVLWLWWRKRQGSSVGRMGTKKRGDGASLRDELRAREVNKR